jgi:hypothetical protein
MSCKKFTLSLLAIAITVGSFAQLSQRTNDPGNFKFGTRPQEGNWGLNFQMPLLGGNTFTDYFKDMPIVNMQYYLSNDLALRTGIRASKHKTVFAGESDVSLVNNGLSKIYNKHSEREYMIYLGLEKHFAPTNLLDVYIGAQVPFGFSSTVDRNDEDYIDNTRLYTTQRNNSFVYGVEGFFGIQAFVADLPVAIGAEWGYAGYGRLYNRTYNSIDNGITKQEYYTNNDGSTTQYKTLNSRTFDAVSMVRLRISYYFNK